jgi:hypothetical protein
LQPERDIERKTHRCREPQAEQQCGDAASERTAHLRTHDIPSAVRIDCRPFARQILTTARPGSIARSNFRLDRQVNLVAPLVTPGYFSSAICFIFFRAPLKASRRRAISASLAAWSGLSETS